LAKQTPITAEEYAAWRADPVTEWVIGELANAAEAQKAGWIEHSWNGGACDPVLLNELKTRADAYRTLAELSYEDLLENSDA
jgi:hypothetical protein